MNFIKYNWQNSVILYIFLASGLFGAIALLIGGNTENGLISLSTILVVFMFNLVADYVEFKKLKDDN